MAEKLTKPRRTFLERVARGSVCRRYSDRLAKALYLAGLVEWDSSAGSGLWWLKITTAGRAALRPTDGEGG